MDALARFVASPFLVEGPAAAAALAMAACVACLPAPAAASPPAPSAQAGYADAARTVQAGLDAWLGKGRAVVVDRSADPAQERGRLARAIGPKGKAVLADEFALASPSARQVGKVCLVVGEDPAAGPADILSVEGMPRTVTGDVGYRDAQLLGLWRSAALCGKDKAAEASAMAVLAASKASASRDLPGLAAAYVDLSDYASGAAGGVSGFSAQRAAVAAVGLRAQGRMATMGYGELAKAAAVAASGQPTSQDLSLAYGGVLAARDLKAVYVPVTEGAVAVDWRTWLRRSAIPQAAHLGKLLDYVEGKGRNGAPVGPLAADAPDAFGIAGAAARSGDSGAKAFLGAIPPGTDDGAGGMAPVTASWDGVPGTRVPFDRTEARLDAPGDGSAFEILDRATGRELAHGTAADGVEGGAPRPR